MTNADGTFAKPIPRAVPGTRISVYTNRPGYQPRVQHVEVPSGRGVPDAAPATIPVPPLEGLGTLGRAADGILFGDAIVRVAGGRRGSLEGRIVGYDRDLRITIEGPGGKKYETRTDKEGIYSIHLPPGDYVVTTARNRPALKVEIRSGENSRLALDSSEMIE